VRGGARIRSDWLFFPLLFRRKTCLRMEGVREREIREPLACPRRWFARSRHRLFFSLLPPWSQPRLIYSLQSTHKRRHKQQNDKARDRNKTEKKTLRPPPPSFPPPAAPSPPSPRLLASPTSHPAAAPPRRLPPILPHVLFPFSSYFIS